jgi:hypothetical protein
MKKYTLIGILVLLFSSCLSTQDRTYNSIDEIGRRKIIGIVRIEFRIYDDYETFESIKGMVYRKLLVKAKSKYKYLDIDIENISIEGTFSLLNLLTMPLNGYITPFVMKINAKGFVALKE